MGNFKNGQTIGFDITEENNPQRITVTTTGDDYGFIGCEAYDWADSYDADGSEEFDSINAWLEFANQQPWFKAS